MAKNGNESAILKELLSNLYKYANPILNTVLHFKATGSRLHMWLWTLGWPLGIGNFQKLKIMLLPPPYLVPIIKKINCAIF